MNWESFREWFVNLSDKHGVNPVIFAVIYFGAMPFFWMSLAWLVKSIKDKTSPVLPIISTGFFFISAYLYVIIFGRNVPWWVYLFIVLLVGFSAVSTWKKVKLKVKTDPA